LRNLTIAIACFSFAAVPAGAVKDEPDRKRPCYYVTGGVQRPGVYEVSAKGVTLKQAVVAAGIELPGDQRSVKLIHLVSGEDEQAFTLKGVLDSNASPALRGGDVIEVDVAGPKPGL
jgi:protein involved in polysaccharide export with SLBB domain